MSFKEEYQALKQAQKILKKHLDHRPVAPKANSFYRTLNDSIVYIANIDGDGGAHAVILRGGFQSNTAGDSYWVDSNGKYQYGEATQMVLSLKERLAIRLPD